MTEEEIHKYHQMVQELQQMGQAHKSNLQEISVDAKKSILQKVVTGQRKYLVDQ